MYSKGRIPKNFMKRCTSWNFDEFKYPDVIMSCSGSFESTKKQWTGQALYGVIKKNKIVWFTDRLSIWSVNSVICPILLYGCEIRGYENTAILKKVNFKVMKFVLHVYRSYLHQTCMDGGSYSVNWSCLNAKSET